MGRTEEKRSQDFCLFFFSLSSCSIIFLLQTIFKFFLKFSIKKYTIKRTEFKHQSSKFHKIDTPN